MNLANKLTMLRVVMIPAFVIVLYADFEGCRYVALALQHAENQRRYAQRLCEQYRG